MIKEKNKTVVATYDTAFKHLLLVEPSPFRGKRERASFWEINLTPLFFFLKKIYYSSRDKDQLKDLQLKQRLEQQESCLAALEGEKTSIAQAKRQNPPWCHPQRVNSRFQVVELGV